MIFQTDCPVAGSAVIVEIVSLVCVLIAPLIIRVYGQSDALVYPGRSQQWIHRALTLFALNKPPCN